MKIFGVMTMAALAIQSAGADSGKTYSSCEGIEISDTDSRTGEVFLDWEGPIVDGEASTSAGSPSFYVRRADGKKSAVDRLTVKVLKTVPFETYERSDEDGRSVFHVSTAKIRLGSDRFEIGTAIVEGDILQPSFTATRTVICKTEIRR